MKCYIFTENEMAGLLKSLELIKEKGSSGAFDSHYIEAFKKSGDFKALYDSIYSKFNYVVCSWKDGKL